MESSTATREHGRTAGRSSAHTGGEGRDLVEVTALEVTGRDAPIRSRLYRRRVASSASPLLIYYPQPGLVISVFATHDTHFRRLVELASIKLLAIECESLLWEPAAVSLEDGRLTLECALESCGAWGVDPRRIALAGDGAGADLVSRLAAPAERETGARVLGALLLDPEPEIAERRSWKPAVRSLLVAAGQGGKDDRLTWSREPAHEGKHLEALRLPGLRPDFYLHSTLRPEEAAAVGTFADWLGAILGADSRPQDAAQTQKPETCASKKLRSEFRE